MSRRPSAIATLLVALLGAACGPAVAADLLASAFASAMRYDPAFSAARFEHTATGYNLPLARAQLLPSLAAMAGRSTSHGWRESVDPLAGQAVRQDLDYRSPVVQLQLRVPLLNLDAITRYRQSFAQISQADATLEARRLELLDRLGAAYFERLLADDVVALAQAQVEATGEQRSLAERLQAGGEGTRVDVAEADAAANLAEVELLEARHQRRTAQSRLRSITGDDTAPRAEPVPTLSSQALSGLRLDEWQSTARLANPGVKARQAALRVASLEVDRARAGHAPRIDLVGSAYNSQNESLGTLNQKAVVSTIGIQLTLPLFNGFAVVAATDQAAAMRGKVASELDGEIARVALEVERQFLAAESAAEKLGAYQNAVRSKQVALEGAQRGLLAGLRVTADVLVEQRQLFRVRRELAQTRYDYLLARLRLQAVAGMQTRDVIADIDQFLVHAR